MKMLRIVLVVIAMFCIMASFNKPTTLLDIAVICLGGAILMGDKN